MLLEPIRHMNRIQDYVKTLLGAYYKKAMVSNHRRRLKTLSRSHLGFFSCYRNVNILLHANFFQFRR
jgi:hypothetical protein